MARWLNWSSCQRQVASPDKQYITLRNLETTSLFYCRNVFGHHALASLHPVNTSNHRYIDHDTSAHDAILG